MIDVCVCVGSSCHLKGSYPLVERLKALIEGAGLTEQVELRASFCTGECVKGVCVSVNDKKLYYQNASTADALFNEEILPLAQKAAQ